VALANRLDQARRRVGGQPVDEDALGGDGAMAVFKIKRATTAVECSRSRRVTSSPCANASGTT